MLQVLWLDHLAPFGPAPFPHRYEKGAKQAPKKKKKRDISHDSRHNPDGTWKLGIDCQRLKAEMRDSGAYDSDYSNVPDGEYYYGSDYLRVCTLGMKGLPGFYKDHWLIDSGASDHITPYLEDFSNLAQGEQFASTANGSIIKMHGPGTIVLKQDHRSTPPVTLTGV